MLRGLRFWGSMAACCLGLWVALAATTIFGPEPSPDPGRYGSLALGSTASVYLPKGGVMISDEEHHTSTGMGVHLPYPEGLTVRIMPATGGPPLSQEPHPLLAFTYAATTIRSFASVDIPISGNYVVTSAGKRTRYRTSILLGPFNANFGKLTSHFWLIAILGPALSLALLIIGFATRGPLASGTPATLLAPLVPIDTATVVAQQFGALGSTLAAMPHEFALKMIDDEVKMFSEQLLLGHLDPTVYEPSIRGLLDAAITAGVIDAADRDRRLVQAGLAQAGGAPVS